MHCPALAELHLHSTKGLSDHLLARARAHLAVPRQKLYHSHMVIWEGGMG